MLVNPPVPYNLCVGDLGPRIGLLCECETSIIVKVRFQLF